MISGEPQLAVNIVALKYIYIYISQRSLTEKSGILYGSFFCVFFSKKSIKVPNWINNFTKKRHFSDAQSRYEAHFEIKMSIFENEAPRKNGRGGGF